MNLEEIRHYKPQITRLADEAGIRDIRIFKDHKPGKLGFLVNIDADAALNFYSFAVDVEELIGEDIVIITPKGAKQNSYFDDINFSNAKPL